MKTLSRLTGDAPIIVLDEITEALDALAEYGTHEEFKGNCEEAINAYIEAFGGEIYGMSRFSESTADTPDLIGKVMHVEFAIGKTHMAAGYGYGGVKTGIKLMIHMGSEAEALHALSVLAEGGTVLAPLQPHPEPDDGGCGSLAKDRFGYPWIVLLGGESIIEKQKESNCFEKKE